MKDGIVRKIALIVAILIVLALFYMPLTALAAGSQSITRTFEATANAAVAGEGDGDGFETNPTYAYADGSPGSAVDTDSGKNNNSDPFEPTYTFTSNPSAQSGTWHAVVQPSGASSFPTNYSTLSPAPDTYGLIADDTFTVNQDVIPEFPTVMGVIGICPGIYWGLKKRMRPADKGSRGN